MARDLLGDGGWATAPVDLSRFAAVRPCRPCRCGGPSRRDAEKKNPPEGLALTSKFFSTKNENLVVLGTTIAPTTLE
jgi:hypothetical protein